MKYYIYGIKREFAFTTEDGKKLVPVLLANASLKNPSLADDWASVYMIDNNIDPSVAYVPYFKEQKDGSYKRKFRKEN